MALKKMWSNFVPDYKILLLKVHRQAAFLQISLLKVKIVGFISATMRWSLI